MGNRLGIHSSFPREDITRQNDIKPNNNIKAVTINNNASDKFDLSTSESSNDVNFTGSANAFTKAGDGFSRLMEKMELGGFMVEFLVLDFMGMMLPRTYQAYTRNQEELGHPNYRAGAEEAIREFLTGPSMTLLPMVGLYAAKKHYGSATQVGFSTLDKFQDTMANIQKSGSVDFSDVEKTRKKFIGEIFDEITTPHRVKAEDNSKFIKQKRQEFVDCFENIIKGHTKLENTIKGSSYTDKLSYGFHSLIKKPVEFVKGITGEPLYEYKKVTGNKRYEYNTDIAKNKNKIAGIVSELNIKYGISPENSYEVKLLKPAARDPVCADMGDIKVNDLAEYLKNTDNNIPEATRLKLKAFESNKLSMPKNINSLTSDLINYSKDVIEKLPKKSLEELQSKARTGRKVMIFTTIAAISGILYYIPVLYKRNKQFPGIDGLVDENTPAHSNGLVNNKEAR